MFHASVTFELHLSEACDARIHDKSKSSCSVLLASFAGTARDACSQVGVRRASVRAWERGLAQPRASALPHQFLATRSERSALALRSGCVRTSGGAPAGELTCSPLRACRAVERAQAGGPLMARTAPAVLPVEVSSVLRGPAAARCSR